jgi:hypothetical protein
MSLRITTVSFAFTLAMASVGFANAQAPPPQSDSPAPRIATIEASDLTNWRTAEQSNTRQAYQAYLAQFPNGWFKAVAQVRVQSGLPTNTSPIPFIPNRNNAIFSEQRFVAWDRRLWENATAIATHNAYRDYLLLSPFGAYMTEAADAYKASLPKLPEGVPADCDASENGPRRLNNIDIGRMYPAEAIRKGLTGFATGDVMIDHTGRPIGYLNSFFVNPEAFRQTIEYGVSTLRFAPIRAGCTQMPTLHQQNLTFQLGDSFQPSRASLLLATPDLVDKMLEVGATAQMTLPFDRALKLAFKTPDARTLYKITTKSSVYVHIATSRDEAAFSTLQLGAYFRSNEAGLVYLRVAALESLPETTEAPLEITISVVQPQPRGITAPR